VSLTSSAAVPVRRCVSAAGHNFSYISGLLVYRQMHPVGFMTCVGLNFL